MLVSHRKQFIFTKTIKTAGTSIESYFEKYCMPEGEWQKSHLREEYDSETGVIGYRGDDPGASKWYNHMSAKAIQDLIGIEIWNKYFTFTVIRNPFDKLISEFYMFAARELRLLNSKNNSTTEIDLFRTWVKNGNAITDRDKYVINGVECVDFFIRFEQLMDGIKYVCDRISVPFVPSIVPEFKKGVRPQLYPVREYYDRETEKITQDLFSWECERFHYILP